MTERITSKTNPLIQRVKKLRSNRRFRYAQQAYVADGRKLFQEAVRWQTPVETVILQEGIHLEHIPENARLVVVPESLMRDVSRMDAPQGVVFVCQMPPARPWQMRPGTLILDGIQDPGNLGTILRTADAFSVPVVISDGCADPYGEKTVRASMGAVLRTPPVQAHARQIVTACQQAGVPIVATALADDAVDITRMALKQAAVVIGSEGQGVSSLFLSAAEGKMIIPMSARCESLNAAVAAAIVLWEMREKHS